jgi:hypothetical protein
MYNDLTGFSVIVRLRSVLGICQKLAMNTAATTRLANGKLFAVAPMMDGYDDPKKTMS